jgi:hypothetical protein
MPPARSTEAALRAEISQLKEQLSAERSQLKEQLSAERCASQQKLLLCKEQLLASKDQLAAKNEALLAMKDENMALKIKQVQPSCNDNASATQHKRRCVTAGSSNNVAASLDKDEILDEIFSYVGGGDHLYVAGVNRRWRGRYLQYCALHGKTNRAKKFVTRHRSAIITESRLQHAKLSEFRITNLDMTQDKHATVICKHSVEPERVITTLRVHGVPWGQMVCWNAAFYGRLGLLQWLRRNDCQWDEHDVLFNASRNGSVPMLQWLDSVTKAWSNGTMTDMLSTAASCDELAAAQWLRAKGAPWPVKFSSEYTDEHDESVKECWSLPAVQWALASGSEWLNWKCRDYAADRYRRAYMQRQATDVLNWAPANGCPCTCGQQQHQQQQSV